MGKLIKTTNKSTGTNHRLLVNSSDFSRTRSHFKRTLTIYLQQKNPADFTTISEKSV